MRRFCRERDLRPAGLVGDDRYAVVGDVAEQLMESLAAIIPVVPVSIVATVFVRASQPLSELEVKAAAQTLMAGIEKRGVPIYIPRQDREYSIQVGLRMLTLRHVVKEHDGLFTANPEESPLLDYYANSIAHHVNPK